MQKQTHMQIRADFRTGQFVCWLPKSKEFTPSCDYKSLVLMNRRAMADADARPIEKVKS